jgi:phosphoglycerate kinase
MMKKAAEKGRSCCCPWTCDRDRFDRRCESRVVPADGIPAGWQGLDIGPATRSLFGEEVKSAGTVIWNGPMAFLSSPASPRHRGRGRGHGRGKA